MEEWKDHKRGREIAAQLLFIGSAALLAGLLGVLLSGCGGDAGASALNDAGVAGAQGSCDCVDGLPPNAVRSRPGVVNVHPGAGGAPGGSAPLGSLGGGMPSGTAGAGGACEVACGGVGGSTGVPRGGSGGSTDVPRGGSGGIPGGFGGSSGSGGNVPRETFAWVGEGDKCLRLESSSWVGSGDEEGRECHYLPGDGNIYEGICHAVGGQQRCCLGCWNGSECVAAEPGVCNGRCENHSSDRDVWSSPDVRSCEFP